MFLKDCNKCIELDPKFIKGYTQKATVHFFMKDYHKALKMHKQAMNIEPNNPDVMNGYSQTLLKIQGFHFHFFFWSPGEDHNSTSLCDPLIHIGNTSYGVSSLTSMTLLRRLLATLILVTRCSSQSLSMSHL